jgi:sortase (surface protein transpeptidase)
MQDGIEQTFQVTQKFATEPSNLSVLYPSQTEKITLITCSDYDFLRDTYLERVIVIAERVR